MLDGAVITQTLDLAAERHADPTPLVYERLFAAHPDMEALFIRDTDGSVRGEMLMRVIEMILDVVGARAYGPKLIQCEVITHEGYGVPREVFGAFFTALAETLRALIGADWTPAMDAAWRALLWELNAFAEQPDQTAPDPVG